MKTTDNPKELAEELERLRDEATLMLEEVNALNRTQLRLIDILLRYQSDMKAIVKELQEDWGYK